MKSHAGCRPDCTPMHHALDCPMAHPGSEARLREALRRIAEFDPCDCGCTPDTDYAPIMREIALEALR